MKASEIHCHASNIEIITPVKWFKIFNRCPNIGNKLISN